MSQNSLNKWRQHLININYTPHTKMTDEQISKMFFRSGNERISFLKWIARELSGNETDGSNKQLLSVLCKHIYIPKDMQNAFIDGNMVCQKELNGKIWCAIFKVLTERKEILTLEDSNINLSINAMMENCNMDFIITSNENDECSAVNEDISPETVHLLNEWESLEQKVNNTLNGETITTQDDFKFSDYVKQYFEFFEKYNNEVKPYTMENLKMQYDPKFEELKTVLPSLCSSYNALKKFSEDGKTIIKNLEKLEELKFNEYDPEISSNKARFFEIYKKLAAIGLPNQKMELELLNEKDSQGNEAK